MLKVKLYQLIEDYLEGLLEGETLRDFEERLQTEPDLAKELELHRKLQAELGDPAKRNLRKQLDQLKTEFTLDTTEDKEAVVRKLIPWRKIGSIAAGGLIFGLMIWFFAWRPSVAPELAKEAVELKEEKPPSIPVPEEEAIVKQVIPEQTKKETPKKKERMVKAPIKKELLASTEKNPFFESLILENASQNLYQLELSAAKETYIQALSTEEVAFQIAGSLKTTAPEETLLVVLSVFNSQAKSAATDQALIQFALPLEKEVEEDEEETSFAFAAKEVYRFNVQKALQIPAGRYYYTISLSSNPRVLYTAYFLVEAGQ